MSILLAGLLLAAPQTALPPVPPPAPVMPNIGQADPDALCFVMMGTVSQGAKEAGKESRVYDVAAGYYSAIILARHTTPAALAAAMRGAQSSFRGLSPEDRSTYAGSCMQRFAGQFARMSPAVAPNPPVKP